MRRSTSKTKQDTHSSLDDFWVQTDFTALHQMVEDQKAGRLPKWEPKHKWYEIEYWDVPGPVVTLCKVLKWFLDHVGFVFMLVGGAASIFFAFQLWQVCAEVGWKGLFQAKETLYVVGYLLAMFVINQVRFLLLVIIDKFG